MTPDDRHSRTTARGACKDASTSFCRLVKAPYNPPCMLPPVIRLLMKPFPLVPVRLSERMIECRRDAKMKEE